MKAELAGFIEVSLAEGGPAAAFASGRQSDFETGRFEDFHGGDANMRLVVADKSIVP